MTACLSWTSMTRDERAASAPRDRGASPLAGAEIDRGGSRMRSVLTVLARWPGLTLDLLASVDLVLEADQARLDLDHLQEERVLDAVLLVQTFVDGGDLARDEVLGAELAARITEHCFYSLEAPVLRVGGFDTPYPPSRIEESYLPDLDRILDAVDKAMGF